MPCVMLQPPVAQVGVGGIGVGGGWEWGVGVWGCVDSVVCPHQDAMCQTTASCSPGRGRGIWVGGGGVDSVVCPHQDAMCHATASCSPGRGRGIGGWG